MWENWFSMFGFDSTFLRFHVHVSYTPACLIFFLLIHLQHDSQVRVHWKGAAKTILASCQWYMDKDNIAAMDQERVINLPEINSYTIIINIIIKTTT